MNEDVKVELPVPMKSDILAKFKSGGDTKQHPTIPCSYRIATEKSWRLRYASDRHFLLQSNCDQRRIADALVKQDPISATHKHRQLIIPYCDGSQRTRFFRS